LGKFLEIFWGIFWGWLDKIAIFGFLSIQKHQWEDLTKKTRPWHHISVTPQPSIL
jgi:hypothetical protein